MNMNPANIFFEGIDQTRRWQGRVFDMLGQGPLETPNRILFAEAGMTLKAYSSALADGPALLLIPAPIKRAYIWDLLPRASVVRHCLQNKIKVYLIQWEDPCHEQEMGLDAYADRLILHALKAVEADMGDRQAFIAGHSLGGTFAAIFSTLHPERIRGLILLGSPINFGNDIGAFGPLMELAPGAQALTAILGNVPGSFLDMISHAASPASFETAMWLDWLESLTNTQDMETHIRVSRWMLDEMPMQRRLFEEIIELLYRRNSFMIGNLKVSCRSADPAFLDMPILSVIQPECSVAPARSVLPFHEIVRNMNKHVLRYDGDTGVALQHVGMLVGKNAHRFIWPEIFNWIYALQ
jgi:polyhydroxyalkanoate synthase subunit PhaC